MGRPKKPVSELSSAYAKRLAAGARSGLTRDAAVGHARKGGFNATIQRILLAGPEATRNHPELSAIQSSESRDVSKVATINKIYAKSKGKRPKPRTKGAKQLQAITPPPSIPPLYTYKAAVYDIHGREVIPPPIFITYAKKTKKFYILERETGEILFETRSQNLVERTYIKLLRDYEQ